MPIDFDKALEILQKEEGLDRGAAVSRLKEAYDSNDPEIGNVSGVGTGLLRERLKSIGERFGGGIAAGAVDIPERLVSFLPGSESFERPSEQLLKHIQGQTEPTPYAEGAGELIGQATSVAAPFEALEEGVALSIPRLAGEDFLSTSARRAIAGGIFGGADTRFQTQPGEPDYLTRLQSNVKWGAAGGVVLPPVLETALSLVGGVGSVIGRKLGLKLGETAPPVEPELETSISLRPTGQDTPLSSRVRSEAGRIKQPQIESRVMSGPMGPSGEPDFIMKNDPAPHDAPVGPVVKPIGSISGEIPPETPRNIYNPVIRKSPDVISESSDVEHVGTTNATTGQPFIGEKTVLLQSNRGKVYVNENHIAAKLGKTEPVHVVNPMVLAVSNSPYRDAIEKVFPNAPRLLELYDSSEEPDVMAREVLGRFAKRKGFDSVILKSGDMSKDFILDFKDFEPEKIEGLGKGLAASVRESKPPTNVFARSVDEQKRPWDRYEPDLATKSFGGSGGDPYVERRAIKYNGKVYEGVSPNDDHLDIIKRNPKIRYVNLKTDRGFIGHDGKYYSQSELDTKIAAYTRRYGQPAPGEKVKFSELVGFTKEPPVLDTKEKELAYVRQYKANRLGSSLSSLDLTKPRDLDEAAQFFGWKDTAELARDLRVSKFSPFEMLHFGAKAQTEPPPLVRSGIVPSASTPDVQEALAAISNRYPRIMGQVQQVAMRHEPDSPWIMRTNLVGKQVTMDVNTHYMPDTPEGRRTMAALEFKPNEGKEYIATILEHETTHAAQYQIELRGLRKTFGVPNMRWKPTDPLDMLIDTQHPPVNPELEAIEMQAESREYALKALFDHHKELQARVANVPEEVQQAVYRSDIAKERRRAIPRVVRKYNALSGDIKYGVFAKKVPEMDSFDMDLFDNTSRSGPLDSAVDPEKYFGPEINTLIGAMQHSGLKGGAPFRLPEDVSDDPQHLWFHTRVAQMARQMHVMKDKFNTTLAGILKDYGATNKNVDTLFEATEGLRRMPDGKLVQTLPNVDAKTAKAAERIREEVTDPAYELIHGIDRKAPAILNELQLADTPKTWTRIKLLQLGMKDKVKNPLLSEWDAARRMQGMLNFDESHDLRGDFVDGYLTHQPIKNERADLLDQIGHVDRMIKMGNVDPNDVNAQQMRAKRVQRLQELEVQLAQQRIKNLPKRDTIPKKHFFGPTNVRDNPLAAEVLVDRNLPHVVGRYINGIVSKRYFDQVLHEFSKVSDTLPGSVRDYNVNFINNIRGVRGFREDIGLTNWLNDMNRLMKGRGQFSINDIKKGGDFLVKLQTYFKLMATPVRFPAVQITHLGMTTWPAAGTRAFIKGMGYFFRDPKAALLQVMERGIVERNAEFLGAMDGITPTSQGKGLKYVQAFSQYSDYFRKTVSWHTFRLAALEPGFKPSPLAKLFMKDVPGRSVIEMSKDYADAMTDKTQFRLRAEGKPQAFVGGQIRRAVTQFKPWMINYGTFYKDIIKSGDKGAISRMLAALYFVGGPTAVMGGDLVYNFARNELLKHTGYILPKDTGFQQTANMLGWGSVVGDVDLLSLRSPIGLPSEPKNILPWLAGPTLGTLYDIGQGIYDANGDTGKEVKSTISAISPEARAALDAVEEYRQGGVKSPAGELLAHRDLSSIVVRGLDLSPSVKSQRYNYRNDIITALESGHPETARELIKQARTKGILFGPKDSQQIRSVARHYLRGQKLIERDPESVLR